MSISNPSHLLISRNPRSPAIPQLAPTLLTSRHSPSSSLPSNLLGSWSFTSDDAGSSSFHRPSASARFDNETEDDEDAVIEEDIEIHPTFHHGAALSGRVKVLVGRYEFWCHKDILWFASPFFQSVLDGNWAETNFVPSVPASTVPSPRDSWTTTSPTDTDIAKFARSPGCSGLTEGSSDVAHDTESEDIVGAGISDTDTESVYTEKNASIYLDANEDEPSVAEILKELRELPDGPVMPDQPTTAGPATPSLMLSTPSHPLPPTITQPITTPSSESRTEKPSSSNLHQHQHQYQIQGRRRSSIRHSFSSAIRVSKMIEPGNVDGSDGKAEAVVELHEESAAAFQEFLFWCYPHLECKVTWTNVEKLLPLSLKLLAPALQKLCEHFLMTHASGKPVITLMLAEQHGNAELYREASRFVLDQPTWDKEEMGMLDETTQLKLSQRRNWFLERLLKLGTIDVKREYTCRPDCPDPARCQVTLDEKWRQAHFAVCRYGPPQPSIAYRCLRQLETLPTNPSLIMPHPYCQRAAQSWIMTLFDRMFQPKMLPTSLNPGTEKYWLWISLTE